MCALFAVIRTATQTIAHVAVVCLLNSYVMDSHMETIHKYIHEPRIVDIDTGASHMTSPHSAPLSIVCSPQFGTHCRALGAQ